MGLGAGSFDSFDWGFRCEFLLQQRHLAREDVEPLLLHLRDERALIDRRL
jgi:hypothetical protein